MPGIATTSHTGRAAFQCVFEWLRNIRSRNGTDDARRARASRLLMQQSCAGLPIVGYPYGDISSPHRTRLRPGVLEP